MSQEQIWFYASGAEPNGPVERAHIEALVRGGQIGPQTLVWRDGLDGWVELAGSELAGLVALQPLPVDGSPASPPIEKMLAREANAAVESPALQMGEAIIVCFRKFFTFSGRAKRPEFWYFTAFVWIVGIVLTLLDLILTGPSLAAASTSNAWALITFFPSLSATVRRLHDTDRSGWWIWLVLVPLIGLVVLVFFLCQRGTIGRNRFA